METPVRWNIAVRYSVAFSIRNYKLQIEVWPSKARSEGAFYLKNDTPPVLLPNFGNKTAPSDEGAKVLFVNCQLFSVLAGEEEDLLGFCFGLQEREGGFEPYIVEAD